MVSEGVIDGGCQVGRLAGGQARQADPPILGHVHVMFAGHVLNLQARNKLEDLAVYVVM